MIFYHPDCDLHFEYYGIEIPIADDRAALTFNALKNLDPTIQYFPIDQLSLISREDLLRVHQAEYLEKVFGTEEQLNQAMRVCYELINQDGTFNRYNPSSARYSFIHARETILTQVAMLYESSKYALQANFSYFLGGGMHHGMSFSGRGFCLVNDIVIVLRKLQAANLIKHAWVIDLDAHKGDGTAELTISDGSISTLSIHMKSGWPLNQGTSSDPWFIKSDLDIEVAEGEEHNYLEKLNFGLNMFEKNFPRPDLVIIVGGTDPYEKDELPSTELLRLSKEQMLERDKLVYNFFKRRNIPMSYCMAGGYGKKTWEIYFQFLHFVWQNSSEGTKVSSR